MATTRGTVVRSSEHTIPGVGVAGRTGLSRRGRRWRRVRPGDHSAGVVGYVPGMVELRHDGTVVAVMGDSATAWGGCTAGCVSRPISDTVDAAVARTNAGEIRTRSVHVGAYAHRPYFGGETPPPTCTCPLRVCSPARLAPDPRNTLVVVVAVAERAAIPLKWRPCGKTVDILARKGRAGEGVQSLVGGVVGDGGGLYHGRN